MATTMHAPPSTPGAPGFRPALPFRAIHGTGGGGANVSFEDPDGSPLPTPPKMSSLTARTSSRSPSPSADVDARQGSPVPSALAAANAGAASAGAGAGAYRSRLAGQLGFGRAEPGHAARPGLRGIRASSNESLETGRGHQRLPSRSSLLGMSGGSGAGAGQDHHPEGVSHEPYLGSGADALRRSRKRATPSPPPSLVGVPSSSTTAAHGTPDPDYPYEPEQSPRAASALATSHPSAYARSEYLADPRRRISDEIAPAHPQEPVSGLRRVSDEHLGAGAGTKRSSPDAYHREFPSSESANALSSPPPLPSREGHGQEDAMPPPLVRSYHTPAMTGSRMLHSAHTAGKSVGGVPRSAGRSIRKLGRSSGTHIPARRVQVYQDEEDDEDDDRGASSPRLATLAQEGSGSHSGSTSPAGPRSTSNSPRPGAPSSSARFAEEGQEEGTTAVAHASMQATRGEVTPEPESGLRGSNCSSDLSGSGGSGSGGAGADAARRTATPDPDERANARASAHPNSNRPGAGRMLGSRQRSPRICSNLIERAQLVPSTSGTSAGKQVGGLKRQYPHEYEPAARNSVQGPAPATADNEEEGEAEDDPPPPPPSRSEAHPNARQRSAAAAAAASGAGAGGLGAPSREKENREPGGVERAKKSSAMTAAAMHDIMGAKVPQPVGGAASFGTRRAGVAGPAAAGAVVQGRQPLGPVSAVGNVENTQGQAQVQAKGQGMPPPSEKPAKPVKTTMFRKERWAKLRKAGQGGFSSVWVVRGPILRYVEDPSTGARTEIAVPETEQKTLAMKQVALDRMEPQSQNEIVMEAQLMEELTKREGHEKYILGYHGHEIKPNKYLKIMLELGDDDLNVILRQNQNVPLSRAKIQDYWKQMLEAVQFIHSANMVHSDLKPANFLMVQDRIKLIDFGIAQPIPVDTVHISRDNIVGTPNYMAPEAVRINKAHGRRVFKAGQASDVWSLGCILYQMVYERPPFDHLKGDSKLSAILNSSHVIDFPTRMTSGDPAIEYDIDEDLLECMRSALERDVGRRATIPELLAHGFLEAFEGQGEGEREGEGESEEEEEEEEKVLITRARLRQVVQRVKDYALSGEITDGNLHDYVDTLFANLCARQQSQEQDD